MAKDKAFFSIFILINIEQDPMQLESSQTILKKESGNNAKNPLLLVNITML